jgi:hypothetical protein
MHSTNKILLERFYSHETESSRHCTASLIKVVFFYKKIREIAVYSY